MTSPKRARNSLSDSAQARTKGARGLLDIYNSVSDDILTNLEASDAAYLASVFARGGKADVTTSSLKGRTSTVMESNGVEYERYYLSDKSVMKNTLAAYYKKVE